MNSVRRKSHENNDQFTDWAVELQSIAQNGLKYSHDVFDRERYQQVREIAAQMMEIKTGMPIKQVKTLFCGDEGYQTPKIETRAAIFKDDKILLCMKNLRTIGQCQEVGVKLIFRLRKIALKKQRKNQAGMLNLFC